MKLSPNFHLNEFVSTADPGRPSEDILESLTALCLRVLEPLRDVTGKPIKVTSGWRSKAHNRAVGGADGSMHLTGIAVDIAVPDDQMLKVAAIASKLPAVGGVGVYPGRNFIHLDMRVRVGGKPTWWMQKNGKYQGLPLMTKAELKRLGAIV